MNDMIFQGLFSSVFVLFYGMQTFSIDIKGKEEGLLNGNGTEIECFYTHENIMMVFSVSILAFNRRMMSYDQIATYIPDKIPVLTKTGNYLKGRVTLTNITESSTSAVLTFNKLMCIDDTFYICKVNYLDFSSDIQFEASNNISITVQVPPSKPDSVSIVHQPADRTPTSSTYMEVSTLSPSSTLISKENRTFSALQPTKLNDKTAFNSSKVPTTDISNEVSTVSNIDLSSDISFRTTTYATQQCIAEGDYIIVVCTGDVGKPAAKHVFEKYLHGQIVPMHGTINATSTSISELPDNCSSYRTTNLTFKVTAKDNNVVIRCVVDSPMADTDMYLETAPIEVYSDKSNPAGSGGNKTKDNGTSLAIATVVVIIVIGAVVIIYVLYSRSQQKKDYHPVDIITSNVDQIESQKTTMGVQPANSTKNTTGYEDVDLDSTDMKFKLLNDEKTMDKVKQHNDEYLKEDEEKEKDNPTTPPQAAVYAFVNKPKNKTNTENKPPADQQNEDVYEESKEGIYDTSGDRRHKKNTAAEHYNSMENLN